MLATHAKHRQAGIDEEATATIFLAALPDESSVCLHVLDLRSAPVCQIALHQMAGVGTWAV